MMRFDRFSRWIIAIAELVNAQRKGITHKNKLIKFKMRSQGTSEPLLVQKYGDTIMALGGNIHDRLVSRIDIKSESVILRKII